MKYTFSRKIFISARKKEDNPSLFVRMRDLIWLKTPKVSHSLNPVEEMLTHRIVTINNKSFLLFKFLS